MTPPTDPTTEAVPTGAASSIPGAPVIELRNPVNPTGRHVGREPGVRLPADWRPYVYRGADQPETPKPARRKKPKKQRALKPHGSVAAIRRHEKAKEPYCGPCATKAKEFYAEQYRLKKERRADS